MSYSGLRAPGRHITGRARSPQNQGCPLLSSPPSRFRRLRTRVPMMPHMPGLCPPLRSRDGFLSLTPQLSQLMTGAHRLLCGRVFFLAPLCVSSLVLGTSIGRFGTPCIMLLLGLPLLFGRLECSGASLFLPVIPQMPAGCPRRGCWISWLPLVAFRTVCHALQSHGSAWIVGVPSSHGISLFRSLLPQALFHVLTVGLGRLFVVENMPPPLRLFGVKS